MYLQSKKHLLNVRSFPAKCQDAFDDFAVFVLFVLANRQSITKTRLVEKPGFDLNPFFNQSAFLYFIESTNCSSQSGCISFQL